MKNKSIILLLLILLTANVYSSETLNLSEQEAVNIGLEQSRTIKISASKVKAANAKVSENTANGLPSLKFLGSYTRLSPVDPFKIQGFTLSPAINDNYSAKLTLSQPLFMGNRIDASIEASEFNRDAANEDLSKETTKLKSDIRTAYWNLYKSVKTKMSILESIEQTKAHLTDVQNFFKAGMSIENEILKVKVQLSNLELQNIDAENSIDIAQVGLCNLLNLSLDTKIELAEEPNIEKTNIDIYENYKETALTSKPELKAMELRVKAGESSVNIAKAAWYPQIALFADYNFANPNQRIQPSKAEFIGTWDIGISLSYDIWNWNTTSLQTEQARESYYQAVEGKKQLENTIELETKQSFLNLTRSIKKIDISKETVEQAKENRRVTNEKFKAGTAINSDLLDSETSLLQAEINYYTALSDYKIAYAKLQYSIGK